MDQELTAAIRGLISRASSVWLKEVCAILRSAPPTATADFISRRLPVTGNADLAHLLQRTLEAAVGVASWEAVGYGLKLAYETRAHDQESRQIEMLWSGPPPAGHLPARRIDQALYDLIDAAKREILLVTFAAAKVERLAAALLKASDRGVKIRLILEFAEASEGQLSFDALRAFPAALVKAAEVYYWPVENRERNQAGRPGKLHAKLAVVDDAVLLSSANLTDDAFSRNLELGVKLRDPAVIRWSRDHFETLIQAATLTLLND